MNTERANTLWKLSHPNEIQQCQLSTSHARQSLFYTLFPLLQDRCLLLAHMEMFEQMKATKSNNWKLLSSVFYPKSFNFTLPKNEPLLRGLDLIDRASILQEAQLWYNDQANQLEVHKMLVKLWIQRINQFICLYGNTKVQLIPCESRNYDYDILYSTCYDSTALTLRTLQKDDRVKLRNAPGNSTVIKVYSDGLVALRHDNGGNGLYKRERIIELTSQTYLPFHGISSPQLDNFICYLLCLQQLLLPESELINAMSDLVPICPKDIDHSIKVTFIEIIEMLDFMSLSKIDLGSSCITWNDLLFILYEEGIRRLSSRS